MLIARDGETGTSANSLACMRGEAAGHYRRALRVTKHLQPLVR
jgi:hypothetical protein